MIAGIISRRVKVTRVLKESGFILVRVEKIQSEAAINGDTLK